MGAVVTLNALNRDDYDTKYSVNEKEIRCYSKTGLKRQYPKGNYLILGETYEDNAKEQIATMTLGGKTLSVSEPGKNFRPFFHKTGYIEVGENAYIILLKKQKSFVLLCGGLLSGIIVTIAALLILWFTTPAKRLDFILPPEDGQAKNIENDNSKKRTSTTGGAVSLGYSLEAYINLSSKEISMFLQNPNASNKDVSATLYIQSGENDVPIARSGLVKAGKELRAMTLNLDGIALQSGTYNGFYLLDFYDSDSGDKSLMNSKIDHVKIKVN